MKFKSNIEIQAGLEDASGSPGAVNQLLSSTVTGTAWIDPSTIVAEAATLVVIACKNTSGAAIAQGTPVYQTGTVGATATIEIAPADALISANKLPAIGLLQTALNNNGFGFVVITGELTNFTTSPIDGVVPTTGDKIFVKSGGGLTLTKPTGEGNGIQNMGLVGKVSTGSAGSITVSSIMRTNDVPNLPEGRIWVGDGNTIVSDTVYVDEPNNRVGIGTTSPAADFVVSHQGTSGIEIEANFQMGVNSILSFDRTVGALAYETMRLEAGDFWFLVLGVERMRIDSAGNVGIGTNSPSKKLEVSSATDTTISIASSDTSLNAGQNIGILEFASNNETSLSQAYTAFSKIKGISETAVSGTASVNGAITFETASANVFGEKMRIASDGAIKFNTYGAGTLVTDSSGNITVSSGGGAGGPYLPLAGGTMAGTITMNNNRITSIEELRFNNGGNIGNQINTDVDTGTETVANVSITDYTAAFFDFVIKKTTNVRSGTVYACHDGTNVEFTETSTNDLGDTSDVTLSVDISGTNMRLLATVTSDDWSVKSLIRAI